jgi:hypothetical protein
VRLTALRRRAFTRHIHRQNRHLVALQVDLAVELADTHRRLAPIDQDHDAIVAVLTQLGFGAHDVDRAIGNSLADPS